MSCLFLFCSTHPSPPPLSPPLLLVLFELSACQTETQTQTQTQTQIDRWTDKTGTHAHARMHRYMCVHARDEEFLIFLLTPTNFFPSLPFPSLHACVDVFFPVDRVWCVAQVPEQTARWGTVAKGAGVRSRQGNVAVAVVGCD